MGTVTRYLLTPPPLPEEPQRGWKASGLCQSVHPVVNPKKHPHYPGIRFDPDHKPKDEVLEVILTCSSCIVRPDCLLYALQHENDVWATSGIWGGMTPPERGRFRKELAAAGRTIEHEALPMARIVEAPVSIST